MKLAALTLATLVLGAIAFAQEGATVQGGATGTVSIHSKGADVRNVIHDLFQQVERNYVLEPNVRFVLYLSLNDLEFEEALQLVCKLSSLDYEIQNGIYFVGKKKVGSGSPATQPTTQPLKPKGKLDPAVLNKRVTTRFDKIDLRQLMSELGKQTVISIEVDTTVPSYKLDAYLIDTSLKYALDVITEATKLKFEFTDNLSIRLAKAEKVGVSLVSGS